MEKLSFLDLVTLATSLHFDLYSLFIECKDSSGKCENCRRVRTSRDSLTYIKSEDCFDKLSVLIRVLQEIYTYRPLPF